MNEVIGGSGVVLGVTDAWPDATEEERAVNRVWGLSLTHGCLYTKQFAPDTDGANPRPLPTLLLANLDGGFAVDAQARRTASAAPAAARTPTP